MGRNSHLYASLSRLFIEPLEERTLLTTFSMTLAPTQTSQTVSVDLSKNNQSAIVSFYANTKMSVSSNDQGDTITDVSFGVDTDGGTVDQSSIQTSGLTAEGNGTYFDGAGNASGGYYQFSESISWSNDNRGVKTINVDGSMITLNKGSKSYSAHETITIPAGSFDFSGDDNQTKATNGVSIDLNNDDDNSDGTPDNHNDYTAGENDLVPLTLHGSGTGGEYQLDFTDSGASQSIKVWAMPDKSADEGSAHILGGTNGGATYRIGSDHTIIDASVDTTLYVEGFKPGQDMIRLY